MPSPPSLRRSLLVTPGDNTGLLTKLSRSHADVAVLELEDGVHSSRKQIARETVVWALGSFNWGKKERVVRINPVSTDCGRRDLEAVIEGRPDALLLPSVESVFDVTIVSQLLTDLEERNGVSRGKTALWLQVETARGICEVEKLVSCDPRVAAVLLGCGDLSSSLRVKRIGIGSRRINSLDGHELLYSRGRVVTAARAAGLDCFDSGSANLRNFELLRERAEYSAQMGFTGVIVVSPRHVDTINEVFSPPDEDVKWAQRVISLSRRNRLSAASTLDDEVITGSVLRGAMQIMATRDHISRFEE